MLHEGDILQKRRLVVEVYNYC